MIIFILFIGHNKKKRISLDIQEHVPYQSLSRMAYLGGYTSYLSYARLLYFLWEIHVSLLLNLDRIECTRVHFK